MKRRFILVDTENVQNRWFELLGNLREKDKIIVFYTENHSKKLQDYLEVSKGGKRLRWVECISGEDALDYQLLGVLSYLIYIHPKADYTIYSNDKGYQDAVSHWKDKGVRIKLAGFSTERAKENPENNETDTDNSAKDSRTAEKNSAKENRAVEKNSAKDNRAVEKNSANKAAEKNSSRDNRVAEETEGAGKKKTKQEAKPKQINVHGVDSCVWEIGKSLPFEEKAAYHDTLVALLGQEKGGKQYQIIQKSKVCQEILKDCYLENQRERTVHFIQTILQYHSLNKSYGQVIYQILQKGDLKNLQDIKRSFDSNIGAKPEQQKYYTVMKKHFKLIKQMMN